LCNLSYFKQLIIIRHAFGSSTTRKVYNSNEKKGIKDAVNFFMDPNLSLLYLVGKYVVLKEVENNTMKHI